MKCGYFQKKVIAWKANLACTIMDRIRLLSKSYLYPESYQVPFDSCFYILMYNTIFIAPYRRQTRRSSSRFFATATGLRSPAATRRWSHVRATNIDAKWSGAKCEQFGGSRCSRTVQPRGSCAFDAQQWYSNQCSTTFTAPWCATGLWR